MNVVIISFIWIRGSVLESYLFDEVGQIETNKFFEMESV